MTINKKHTRPKPVALIMVEGWGIAPASDSNRLVDSAPCFKYLTEHYPVGVLSAAGEDIGLPAGLASNSEIAHAVIGSGRKFFNPQQNINEKIVKENFAKDEQFKKLASLMKTNNNCHLIGLLSSSELEASISHLKSLIFSIEKLGNKKIYLHCIIDGKETNKNSGQKLVEEFSHFLADHPACQLVSLIGRLYGLDDKANLSRTSKAFKLFARGEGNVFSSAKEAFDQFYEKKIFDEEFPPVVIRQTSEEAVTISEQAVVVFWNYAGQGIKQLANYFLSNLAKTKLVSLVDYNLGDRALVLFPNPELSDSLGKVFSVNNLRQLRLAESLGFPNVAMAFDSYTKNFSELVDKKLISTSINSSLSDIMVDNIKEIRRAFNEAVQKSIYDFIVVTFSQIDFMAHNQPRADLPLVIKAFDDSVKLMIDAITASGGVAVIVGTHGFAEQVADLATGKEIFTHSLNPVPLYLIGKTFEGYNLGWPEAVGGDLSLLKPIGSLVDIAPTILTLVDLPIPSHMIGHSLI